MSILHLKSVLYATAFLLVGGTVVAVGQGAVAPEATKSCLYQNGSCVFPDGTYWSGCDQGYPTGWISGATAEGLCEDLHTQN
jgi:hypothetical protein